MAAESIYDLNDYCLSTIFEFLAFDDLMNINLTTKRFQQVVREFVIPRQVVDVVFGNDFQSAKTLFQTFGKYITKIACRRNGIFYTHAEDEPYRYQTKHIFEAFLQMLLDYCEPGMLKEVTIRIYENIQRDPIDPNLITRTAAYFQNVTSLKIGFLCDDPCYLQIQEWLTSIPDRQIRSLHIMVGEAARYDFKLNPNSFPNLRDFNLQMYPRDKRSFNEITEFVRGKVYLESFFLDGSRADVVQFVANHFPNIKLLGDVDLDSNIDEINLRQLTKLESLAINGCLRNYRKFDDIIEIVRSQNTLKHLAIYLQRTYTSECFLSLGKSKYNNEKMYLENLCLWIEDDEPEEEIYSLFINMFNFKRLQIVGRRCRLINKIVRNIGCLETLVCPALQLSKEIYQELMIEKRMINGRIGSSKLLSIYIRNAEQLISDFGNDYDPHLITLAPISEYLCKCVWGNITTYC